MDRYGTCGDNLECRHFPETGESTCVCREDKEVVLVVPEIMIIFEMMTDIAAHTQTQSNSTYRLGPSGRMKKNWCLMEIHTQIYK